MSDPVQIALITAATAFLASLPVTVINVMNGIRSRARAETIIEKTTEIHALTNSQLAAVTSELKLANSKIEGLQALISSLQAAQVATLTASDKKV